MIKALLVDDEELALDLMQILLEEIGGVAVLGKFLHAAEALEQIEQLQPDVIFLDIEMPGMNGLAAAEQLLVSHPQLRVIFVTAYHQYAVDAFDVNARDYLLKPVSKERLIKSLDRFRQERAVKQMESLVPESSPVVENMPTPERIEEEASKLRLHVMGSVELYDRAGGLVSWRTKKTKELFAFLWHHDGAPVYRLRILDALWPHLPPDRAQSLLHTTMYRLRNTLKAMGFPDMIMFADERYRLQTEWIASDMQALDAFIRGKALPTMDVEQLLTLYRGEYMETEHYGWAQTKRIEVGTAYRHCLESCLERADGYLRESIWRKLIELDPYAESYYYALLLELEKSGNVSGMKMLYNQMEKRWREDLGMDVTTEIQVLMRS